MSVEPRRLTGSFRWTAPDGTTWRWILQQDNRSRLISAYHGDELKGARRVPAGEDVPSFIAKTWGVPADALAWRPA